MPNKISEWLRLEAASDRKEGDGYTSCNMRQVFHAHADKNDDYAALVDRLVEAAKRLKVQAEMTDDYCDSIGGTLRNAVKKMSDILREIESEESK